MAKSMLTMTAVLLLSLGGVAGAAPAPQDFVHQRTRTGDPQVDRTALLRTANVGECGAIQRPVAAPVKREREAKPGPAQRKTLASAGCTVVWSD